MTKRQQSSLEKALEKRDDITRVEPLPRGRFRATFIRSTGGTVTRILDMAEAKALTGLTTRQAPEATDGPEDD